MYIHTLNQQNGEHKYVGITNTSPSASRGLGPSGTRPPRISQPMLIVMIIMSIITIITLIIITIMIIMSIIIIIITTLLIIIINSNSNNNNNNNIKTRVPRRPGPAPGMVFVRRSLVIRIGYAQLYIYIYIERERER